MKNRLQRRAKQVLEERGFRINKKNPESLDQAGKIRLDFLAEKEGERYGVEVKSSSSLQSFLKTSLFRAITQVRAACEREGWYPLIVLLLNESLGANQKKLNDRLQLYGPDVAWICDRPDGPPVYRLKSEKYVPSDSAGNTKLSESVRAESAPSSGLVRVAEQNDTPGTLSFSDLNLWMFKCLFYNHHRPQYNWKKTEAKIHNGNQLAEHADVSLPTVYDWLNPMEEEGFLDRVKRESLLLQKTQDYLNLWAGKYRIQDNYNRVYRNFVRKTEHPWRKLTKKLRNLPEEKKARYLLTGHPASRVYGCSITSASSLQLFRREGHVEDLEEDLNLVPAGSKPHDLVSYRPKHEEAVFRGGQEKDGIPVVDPIQMYLDCYHLKDRGLEQAEKVKEKFLRNNSM